jgi:hypothetical protein
MDSIRLADKVGVERAKNNSSVTPGSLHVEEQEVPPIVGNQNSALRSGEIQHLRVGHSSIGLPRLARSEYIVAQPAQLNYNLRSDVLIRIKASHYAASFSRICASISLECARA